MTLHDVARIYRFWQRNPPLRVLVASVAATLGVKFPDPPDPSRHMTAEEAKRFVDFTAGGKSIPFGMD